MNKALILAAISAMAMPTLAAGQASAPPQPRATNQATAPRPAPPPPPPPAAKAPPPPAAPSPLAAAAARPDAANQPITVTAIRKPDTGGSGSSNFAPLPFVPSRDPSGRMCNQLVLHDEGFRGPAESERVLDVNAGAYVSATIEGVPMRLRVDLDAPAYFIRLNPDAAKRVHATGCIDSFISRDQELVETIRGEAVVAIGDQKVRRHIYWSRDTNYVDGDGDGIIGVQALPENRVTFKLHAPVEGEHRIELPFKDNGGYIFNMIEPGGRRIALFYAPSKPQSIATAAGAAYLAATQDGRWSGPPTTLQVPVWFEAPRERPARAMTLDRPLSLSGLPLRGFMVRTADFKGTYKLPVDNAAPVLDKKPIGDGWLEITLGQDALGGCSSITLDKKRGTLTLYCL